MKAPEHMDSADLFGDGQTDDELRASLRRWLDENDATFDAADFFECYIDPEGPFRYCGSFSAWDGIKTLIDCDPHLVAEQLREYIKECC